MYLKITLGIISISIILLTLYAIGRIIIRIIQPDNRHPDFEQVAAAALIGVLIVCIIGLIGTLAYVVGESVMQLLA